MRLVFNYVVGFLVLAGVAVSCYLIGYDHGAQQLSLPGGARDQQQQKILTLTKDAEELRQQVANLKLNADIDQQANKDIRRQLMQQTVQIAALERDIAVYRSMMSSGRNANPQGISIGVFHVTRADQADAYHYKLVLQKLAAMDDPFQGDLNIKIVGVQTLGGEEKPRSLSLHELSDQVAAEQISLSFKYFQNIEGDLVLPGGFKPEKIQFLVKSTNRKHPATIENELEWQLSEL
jgi:hypothetical protein